MIYQKTWFSGLLCKSKKGDNNTRFSIFACHNLLKSKPSRCFAIAQASEQYEGLLYIKP